MTPVLRVRDLGRSFGSLTALRGVDLEVRAGEVHAVLGENGAGKSTLMNVLFGLLEPDSGTVEWRGAPLRWRSPAEALAAGIGMVHQHFQLVDRLTVWENVRLSHPDRARLRLDPPRGRAVVRELARRYALRLDPDAAVGSLPVGERQHVEIAKALCRPCSLLILDEPTAVLAPPDVEALFEVVRRLASEGTAVLFISHKLDEVRRIADRVTVLRRGRVVARSEVRDADPEELTRAILGELPAPPQRGPGRAVPGEIRLEVRGLRTAGRLPLRDISFDLRAGEILAVGGIDGNGQDELVAALAGLLPAGSGEVRLRGEDVTGLSPGGRWRAGLAVVPGDRSRDGILPDAPLWENLALREFGAPWARGRLGAVVTSRHRERARSLIRRHDVRADSPDVLAGRLSGGNQQKLLFARELAADPAVFCALNPTRGLDVGAARALIDELRALRDRGGAVLFFSTELDEVLEVGDRRAILRGGRWIPADGDAARLGALLVGAET